MLNAVRRRHPARQRMLPKGIIPTTMLNINHVFATVKKMRDGIPPQDPHNRPSSTSPRRSCRAVREFMRG
jgi:hypothetical protein